MHDLHCVACGTLFPPNRTFATLAAGHRFAYDTARDRVWRICSACEEWNLLGPDASAAALPEVRARFATGLIQAFDGLALSTLADQTQLVRLGAADTGESPAAPSMPGRDDVARLARRQEVDRRGRQLMSFFWVMLVLWGLTALTTLVDMILDGGVLFAAGAVVAWVATIGVFSLLWRRHQPSSPSLFTPWRQPTRLAQLINGGMAGYLLQAIMQAASQIHGRGFRLRVLAVLLGVLGFIIPVVVSVPGKGRTAWSPRALRSFMASSVAILVATIVAVSWGRSLLVPGLALGYLGFIAALMLIRSRRVHFTIVTRAGVTIPVRRELRHMAVHWSDETHGFRVTGLPGGALEGDDAMEAVGQLLRLHHHRLPQLSDRTEQAWQLLRSVGDLRGLLAMLAGYRSDHDGRLDLATLPPVYRLALDFALADRRRVADGIAPLRDAAEVAAEVAREAEALDREMENGRAALPRGTGG